MVSFRSTLDAFQQRKSDTLNQSDIMAIAIGKSMAEGMWEAMHSNHSENFLQSYGLPHNSRMIDNIDIFTKFSYAAILIQKNVRMFLCRRFYKILFQSKYRQYQLLFRKYQKITEDGRQERIFHVIGHLCASKMCIRFIVNIKIDELIMNLLKEISVKE